MSLLLLCHHQLTIERAAVSTDATGGVLREWQPLATNVPATILTLRASTPAGVDRRGILTSHLIISPYNAAVRVGDRVHDGTNFYLVRFLGDLGDRGEAWAIFAEMMDPQS